MARKHPRRRAPTTIVLSTLLLTFALAGVPAAAASGLWTDPRGDMTRTGVETTPAPNHTVGDIRRLKVRHGDRFVWIRVAFTELARQGQCIQLSSAVRSDRLSAEDPAWFFSNAGPSCDDPGSGTWQPRTESWGPGGVRVSWAWERNLIVARFSRAALSRPRWVRVSISALHVGRDSWFRDRMDQPWTPRVYP